MRVIIDILTVIQLSLIFVSVGFLYRTAINIKKSTRHIEETIEHIRVLQIEIRQLRAERDQLREIIESRPFGDDLMH